jgi:sulfur relay protein TusB/DsrH
VLRVTLYLLDKPYGRNGLNLLRAGEHDKVVLVKDGLYLDTNEIPSSYKIFAIIEEVVQRGLRNRLGIRVELIDYDKLVDMIVQNKVANFA